MFEKKEILATLNFGRNRLLMTAIFRVMVYCLVLIYGCLLRIVMIVGCTKQGDTCEDGCIFLSVTLPSTSVRS